MRETKRRRLEARGWRVGNTKEFLGLSDDEAAYIELKLKLGRAFESDAAGADWPKSIWRG